MREQSAAPSQDDDALQLLQCVDGVADGAIDPSAMSVAEAAAACAVLMGW